MTIRIILFSILTKCSFSYSSSNKNRLASCNSKMVDEHVYKRRILCPSMFVSRQTLNLTVKLDCEQHVLTVVQNFRHPNEKDVCEENCDKDYHKCLFNCGTDDCYSYCANYRNTCFDACPCNKGCPIECESFDNAACACSVLLLDF